MTRERRSCDERDESNVVVNFSSRSILYHRPLPHLPLASFRLPENTVSK